MLRGSSSSAGRRGRSGRRGRRRRAGCRSEEDGQRGWTILIARAVDGHRDRWVVVFESREARPPEFARAEMALGDSAGEVEMDALDIFWE